MLARNKNSSSRGVQSGGAGLSVSINCYVSFLVWFIGVRCRYAATSSDLNNIQHF